jgi:hypothetical protein
MKVLFFVTLLPLICATSAFATVVVSSPSNGETVGSNVHYAATATTSTCSRGVASIGVYVDNQLIHFEYGDSLEATLPISTGKHNTVVEEWDYCGSATFISMEITVNNASGVFVTSPANGSTVNSTTDYVATATSSCSKGVAAMGVYVNNQLVTVSNGAKLNTQLSLNAGNQHTVVEEWDECGGATYTTINVMVKDSGIVLSNLQASGGWNGWGELAPIYDICSEACSGVDWSMVQHVNWPSLSGNATQFNLSGTAPYADALWSNPLIGQFSTQGLPDEDRQLLPTLHNFTYDAYFYMTDAQATQVLEFDISMYMNGVGMIWGNQCRVAGGNEWDIWDNVNARWIPTGVACHPNTKGWNHVTIRAQRGPDNQVVFQSIALNGAIANIDKSYPAFYAPIGWWGVTVNYQMDGNYTQAANTTYLDNLSLRYW